MNKLRKGKTALVIFAGLLLMFRAGSITASADEGKNGNNGDVKIHAVGTAQADNRNEPHVCAFYVDAFKFDANSTVTYHIDQHAPTGTAPTAAKGAIKTDAKGNGRSADQTLPNGHYKLFAKQTVPATPGGDKQKVFWVECGTTSGGTTSGAGGSVPSTDNHATTPPSNGGQQNNGSNGSGSTERASIPTNSKSKNGGSKSGTQSKSKKGGSATGTRSASKGGTKATNNASVASQGNNASGTNSMQTISKEEGNLGETGTPTPTPVAGNTPAPAATGGATTPAAGTTPTTNGGTQNNGTNNETGATPTTSGGTQNSGSNNATGAVTPTVETGNAPANEAAQSGTNLPAVGSAAVVGAQAALRSMPTALAGVQQGATPDTQAGVGNIPSTSAFGQVGNVPSTAGLEQVGNLPSTSTSTEDNLRGVLTLLGLGLIGLGARIFRRKSHADV